MTARTLVYTRHHSTITTRASHLLLATPQAQDLPHIATTTVTGTCDLPGPMATTAAVPAPPAGAFRPSTTMADASHTTTIRRLALRPAPQHRVCAPRQTFSTGRLSMSTGRPPPVCSAVTASKLWCLGMCYNSQLLPPDVQAICWLLEIWVAAAMEFIVSSPASGS